MTFGGIGSFAILNAYDVPYLPLKFVPLITNHPVYMLNDYSNFMPPSKKTDVCNCRPHCVLNIYKYYNLCEANVIYTVYYMAYFSTYRHL